MIHRNIELEARLIDDLLNLSRLSRGRMRLDLEIIDIHEAIRRAIEICRDATFVAGLDVVTELDAPHHHVTADHARVMQIVWNLIHNAAKFTPPNGRLTIRTLNLPDPDRRRRWPPSSDRRRAGRHRNRHRSRSPPANLRGVRAVPRRPPRPVRRPGPRAGDQPFARRGTWADG